MKKAIDIYYGRGAVYMGLYYSVVGVVLVTNIDVATEATPADQDQASSPAPY